MSSDAVALWNSEAPAFDEAPDHGLLDPGVRAAWRACCSRRCLPRRRASPTSAVAPAPWRCSWPSTGTPSTRSTSRPPWCRSPPRSWTPPRPPCARWSPCAVVTRPTRGWPGIRRRRCSAGTCCGPCPTRSRSCGRWVRALRPGGRLVLVEGDWSTGAGLSARRCAEIVGEWCCRGRGAAPARPGAVGPRDHRRALPGRRSPLRPAAGRRGMTRGCHRRVRGFRGAGIVSTAPCRLGPARVLRSRACHCGSTGRRCVAWHPEQVF